jgi:hypothetical protein
MQEINVHRTIEERIRVIVGRDTDDRGSPAHPTKFRMANLLGAALGQRHGERHEGPEAQSCGSVFGAILLRPVSGPIFD